MRALLITSALALCGTATPALAVNLIGQSVNASFTSNVGNANLVQFASPQTVGAGVEFTGSFTDIFFQDWTLALDVGATGFTLNIDDGVNGNVTQSSPSGALQIQLSNLSGIGALSFTSYSCSPSGSFACGAFEGGPSIVSSGSDATSAFVWLRTLRTGERYEFSFAPEVPEPASWAMMIGGFALMGAAMRRRKTPVSFA